ncbi:MAG: DEAD/DEAH box helicase [Candidatus Firestonebacteria bacterium]|nr:DEAD/DEAH box helicase [Candidatus Firestonebacteria bacterium]
MSASFENLGLDQSLVKALEIEKITKPTNIQNRAITEINQNKDVMIQSETGTGKTLAYLLPLYEKIKNTSKEMKAIILAPTHELAIQIQRQMERLTQNSKLPIRSTPVIGGANVNRQIEKLKDKPQIIVGSPGRILELMQKNKIKTQTIQTIILDEADRLMEKQNIDPVSKIINSIPKDRQIIIVSATLSQNVINMAKEIMNNPVILKSGDSEFIPETITHCYLTVDRRNKLDLLKKLIINLNPPKALVFLNNIENISNLISDLQFNEIRAESLHSTSHKMDRKQVMNKFRSGRLQILVASDIAARGLHMDGITHVFNVDVPEELNFYIHRSGRTGRNDQKGIVISLAATHEFPLLKKIERELKIKIENKMLVKDKLIDNE